MLRMYMQCSLSAEQYCSSSKQEGELGEFKTVMQSTDTIFTIYSLKVDR